MGYKRTLLHACSNGLTSGSTPLLRRLLADPAAIRDIDVGGGPTASGDMVGSPLDKAVHAGWIEGALLLLNSGADVNVRDLEGNTPVITAACDLAPAMGCSDMLRLLALKGANMDAVNHAGRAAVHWAAVNGNTDGVRTLAALGAHVGLVAKNGDTALRLAQAGGHQECAALLQALARDPTACPPRRVLTGEDVLCQLEDVDIVADADLELPEDVVFIQSCVESALLGSQLRASSSKSAVCCDCQLLCIPGICKCLSASGGPTCSELDTVLKSDSYGNQMRTNFFVEELEDDDGSTSAAINLLLEKTKNSRDPKFFANALHVASGPMHERFGGKHITARRVGSAALLAALQAVPGLMPVGIQMGKSWDTRLHKLVKDLDGQKKLDVDVFCTLLLEVDDAVSEQLAANASTQPRMQPVWHVRQTRAWLDHARPCWRAAVRVNGRTIDGLLDVLRDLVLCLRSVTQPLRLGTDSTLKVGSLQMCGPKCLCAAGGCRSGGGVQYPFRLRQTERCGIGAFAETAILPGAPIAQYSGELITEGEVRVFVQGGLLCSPCPWLTHPHHTARRTSASTPQPPARRGTRTFTTWTCPPPSGATCAAPTRARAATRPTP